MKDLSLKKDLIPFLFVIGALLLIGAYFSQLYTKDFYFDLFLSSDALYLPSIYKDVIIENNGIKGWHLNPAPNFFPDMTIYFLLMFITGKLLWSTYIFANLQFIGICLMLLWIYKRLSTKSAAMYGAIVVLIPCLFLLEGLFIKKDIAYGCYILMNSFHTGAFVLSLVCVILSLNYLQDEKKKFLYVIFFLCVLGGFSDRLFLGLYPASLVATLFFVSTFKIKTRVSLILTVILGSLLGLYLFLQLDNNTYVLFKENKVYDEAAVLSSFKILWEQMLWSVDGFSFKAVTIYLFIISWFALLWIVIKRKTAEPLLVFFTVYSLLFSLIAFFSPVITGKYTGHDCLRYNIFPLFCSGLNSALVFSFIGKDRAIPAKTNILGSFIILLIIAGAIYSLDSDGLQKYFNYYPMVVQRIDELADKEKLRNGVGNHWVSKKVTMFSKKGVKVRSVFDEISIYDHVGNDEWFFNNIFTFVVLNNFSDTTLYRQRLKKVRTVSYDQDLKLIKANPFTYHRAVGYRVINFGYKD